MASEYKKMNLAEREAVYDTQSKVKDDLKKKISDSNAELEKMRTSRHDTVAKLHGASIVDDELVFDPFKHSLQFASHAQAGGIYSKTAHNLRVLADRLETHQKNGSSSDLLDSLGTSITKITKKVQSLPQMKSNGVTVATPNKDRVMKCLEQSKASYDQIIKTQSNGPAAPQTPSKGNAADAETTPNSNGTKRKAVDELVPATPRGKVRSGDGKPSRKSIPRRNYDDNSD